jgi:hypothetical protein
MGKTAPYPADFWDNAYDWRFRFRFPSSGNPNGFVETWHTGVFFQVGHGSGGNNNSGISLTVDTTSRAYDSFRIAMPHAPWLPNWTYTFSNSPSSLPVELDRWYEGRIVVRWSGGSNGLVRAYVDGVLIGEQVGIGNYDPGDPYPPWPHIGYYKVNEANNMIEMGPVGFIETVG